jgi:DNA-directed RNA polymerase specialized sigma24 family protein
MQLLGTSKIEEFREKTTPHFNNVYRAALRLTKNQPEAEALTTEVYLKAWTAFCFYKSEIDCRAWLLRILFRQFNCTRQKSAGSEFTEGGNKMLKPIDSLEIESSKKVFV